MFNQRWIIVGLMEFSTFEIHLPSSDPPTSKFKLTISIFRLLSSELEVERRKMELSKPRGIKMIFLKTCVLPCVTPKQTQHIFITLIQRRPNIFDVGPILYKCYTNVLCLLWPRWRHHTNIHMISTYHHISHWVAQSLWKQWPSAVLLYVEIL